MRLRVVTTLLALGVILVSGSVLSLGAELTANQFAAAFTLLCLGLFGGGWTVLNGHD